MAASSENKIAGSRVKIHTVRDMTDETEYTVGVVVVRYTPPFN